MSVRVRMAPSPTGFLHIGGVHTFLFNWLFARGRAASACCGSRTPTRAARCEEATEQIQRSLSWLGIDWDGPVTFQLDAMDRCRELAARLVEEGKAYEDEGAIRFRMPDEGVTGWDDAVRGRIEFPNEQLEDVVIVRSDGRPTYNFASPVEDMDDAITHVIRGDDHISNTPEADPDPRARSVTSRPCTPTSPSILGADGKKLSKRHGAVSVDEFRAAGYLPDALVNFLALIGWAPDGETTIMSRDEIVERFSLEAVSASPGTFDYAKLDWMNGVYLRALDPDAYADAARRLPARAAGSTGPRSASGRRRRSCRRRSAGSASSPASRGSCSATSSPIPSSSTRASCAPRTSCAGRGSSRGRQRRSRRPSRQLCDELGEKPRTVFGPIRVAVTGSRVSPGLYESLELLGRDTSLERLRRGAELAA